MVDERSREEHVNEVKKADGWCRRVLVTTDERLREEHRG